MTIHEAASCSSARDLPLPLQFAALTAARTDVLLHIAADNSGTVHRWPPPSPPQPYAVFVATNSGFRTLPLDFDASKGDPARDAIYTGGMLTECGIRYVTTTSGPTGGRHVLIPVVDPVRIPRRRAADKLDRRNQAAARAKSTWRAQRAAHRRRRGTRHLHDAQRPAGPRRRGGPGLRILGDCEPRLVGFHAEVFILAVVRTTIVDPNPPLGAVRCWSE